MARKPHAENRQGDIPTENKPKSRKPVSKTQASATTSRAASIKSAALSIGGETDDFSFDDFDANSLLNDSVSFEDDATPTRNKNNLKNALVFGHQVIARKFINGLDGNVLNTLIPELPAQGVDLYVIANGRGDPNVKAKGKTQTFEFGELLAHVARLMGNYLEAHISTWSMNPDHAQLLLGLMDEGVFKSLSMLFDPTLAARKRPIYNTLISGLKERKQRYRSFDNHAKVCLLKSPTGKTLTILSSANLSSLPRAENFTLSSDSELHAFMCDNFFEAVLNG